MFRSPKRINGQDSCFLSFVSDLCRSPQIYNTIRSPTSTHKIKLGALKKKIKSPEKKIKSPEKKQLSYAYCQTPKQSLQPLREYGSLQQYYMNLVKSKAQKIHKICNNPQYKPFQFNIQKVHKVHSPPAFIQRNQQKSMHNFSPPKQVSKQKIIINIQKTRQAVSKIQNYEFVPVLLEKQQQKESKIQFYSTNYHSQICEEDSNAKTRESYNYEQSKNKFLGDNLLRIDHLSLPKVAISIAGSSCKNSNFLDESIVIQNNQRQGDNKKYITRLL